jgi:hypothetical protein
MQENYLFEYAVIRVVPRVEREEFLNAGIVMYCASQKYLKMLFDVNSAKLCSFCDKIDIEEVNKYLLAFEEICKGGAHAGPIGKLGIAERFRWLTATRSTIIQTSKVHPGFCRDPDETLSRLYNKLVV